MQVNVLEAKTQLSRLLDRVEAGDVVVIARAGRPVARLVRVSDAPLPTADVAGLRAALLADGTFVRAANPGAALPDQQGTASLANVLADLAASRDER
jgi:prevent-host-death family protein